MDWQSIAESPIQTGEDLRRQLTDKAIADSGFRERLLADPKDAINAELGVELPDDVNVEVHESSASTLHLALPVSEVSEEQLEQIAAGRCCC